MKKFFYLFALIFIITFNIIIAAPNPIQNPNTTDNSLKIIRKGHLIKDNWYTLDEIHTIERVPDSMYFHNAVCVKLKTKAEISSNKKEIYNSMLQSSLSSLNIKEIDLPYQKYLDDTKIKDNYGIGRIYKITYETPIDPYQVSADLMKNPDVEYATPIFIKQLYYSPNDTYFKNGAQYYMDLMQIQKAWDITKGSPNVKIAIVDQATDWTHEDLIDNIWINPNEIPDNGIDDDFDGYIDDVHGWDFVGNFTFQNQNFRPDNEPKPSDPQNSHGTHTAGLASAVTDNGKGIAGTGFNCKIIPIKVGPDTSAIGGILAGYDGIMYASKLGADIISCSWGGSGYSQEEQDVINTATERGSLVVAAAGNGGNSLDLAPSNPASLNNVLTVGSSIGSTLSTFSAYGINVDVYAPGSEIMSTIPGNSYASYSGTSMATPIAAGVAALVKSVHPDWSPMQIAKQIRVTCDRIIAKNEKDEPYYYGFVNAYKAVNYNNTDTTLMVPGLSISNTMILNASSITNYDKNDVKISFINYLSPGKNVKITLIPEDTWVNITDNIFTIPEIATNDIKEIQFQMQLTDQTPWFEGNTRIIVKIEADSLLDYDVITVPIELPTANYFSIATSDFVNPTYYTVCGLNMFTDGSGLAIGNIVSSGNSTGFSLLYKIQKNNATVSTNYVPSDPFYSIYAFDKNNFFIGLGTSDIVGRGYIRSTTNGGNSWTLKNVSAITHQVNFIQFYDNSNGIFLGNPLLNVWGIAKTTDRGNTWTQVPNVPAPLDREKQIIGSGQFSGSDIWFGTTMGRIFYSSDQGNTWSVQTVSADAKPVALLSYIDKDRGMAVCYNSIPQTKNDATILFTTDGGNTWTQSQTD
ncbi:MAG TPA: S8 family serine peptidase, partial [Candidatus Kapabacteria bacterium]|nr:S8 family serine peptidase [Candidatus Kapabacteria bacterium]